MPPELAVVLTVRMESERFPNKVLADVEGKPLMAWIVERLRPLGIVIVATTTLPADDAIVDVARQVDVPCFRGSPTDVVQRVNDAMLKFAPNAKYLLRGLGDCPFIEPSLIARAVHVLRREGAESFLWALSPDCWPIYGAREFPFSRSGWDKIVNNARNDEREHTDLYFHRNRGRFNRVYHDAPPNVYFRQIGRASCRERV